MDVNHNSNTWDLDMTMENPILHDQLSYDLIYQNNFPLQTPQVPSTTHVPISNFPTNQLERNKIEEEEEEEEPEEELGAMKEMMYKIAAMQPVNIDPTTIHKPKRRNVRISHDPQSVAARHRREKISEKMRILQRLVPGGTKMDTASMLDEAILYVKFLKRQVHKLQANQNSTSNIVNNHFEDGNWATRSNNIHGCTSSFNVGDGFTFGGGVGGGEDNISCDNGSFNYEVINE